MKETNYQHHCIRIRGAKTNNLKSVDVDIPYNELIAITGIAGSGKTALGFGTLFAEGSLRYIKSFSTHARQFLEKISPPPVDSIQGILPSIGLNRKKSIENPRATLGTSTDIYNYIKLLYTHIGSTFSPISGTIVKKDTVEDVVVYMQQYALDNRGIIVAPLTIPKGRSWQEALEIELSKGFTRIMYDDAIKYIEDVLEDDSFQFPKVVYIVVDMLQVTADSSCRSRIAESAKTAFFEGLGTCFVHVVGKEKKLFSDRFEADGITFEKPSSHFFSFNNTEGACKKCNGLGQYWGIDACKVIPYQELSIEHGAILPWENTMFSSYKEALKKTNLRLDCPYQDFTPEEKKLLWHGNKQVTGIYAFFEKLAREKNKIQNRILYAHYQGFISCESCQGCGLRQEVSYVKINNKSVIDILNMSIDDLADFFQTITIPGYLQKVATILLEEINNRLFYLKKVGLGYVNLIRKMNTLSGGEYERARLAKILGSPLVDTLYIFDEPTAGLHKHDAEKLIETLVDLKNAGNTVVVVGHEELIMRAASTIIDLGQEAGIKGGNLVFQGGLKDLKHAKNSYTADYLLGKRTIPIPAKRKKAKDYITLQHVNRNNLQNITVRFPLGVFTAVTGVSGSGKSTLIQDILYPSLAYHLGLQNPNNSLYFPITGDVNKLHHVVYMGQNAFNKSKRSYLITYLQVYQYIRELFAQQPLAIERDYTSAFFSLNTRGGRCEECHGDGEISIDMQFMEDVVLACEACNGTRFQQEVLEVTYQGKNIIEVLDMSVEESLSFFVNHPVITRKLKPLKELGMSFLKIGQCSSTFSTGESQLVKIARCLNMQDTMHPTFFIFDEPSAGLHFHDVQKLIVAFNQLREQGHTVLVIEHHLDIIKAVDWIINIGPGSGIQGGKVTFAGTPDEMIKLADNTTAHYLRQKFQAK